MGANVTCLQGPPTYSPNTDISRQAEEPWRRASTTTMMEEMVYNRNI